MATLERYFVGPATVAGLVVGYGHQPPEVLTVAGGVLTRGVLEALRPSAVWEMPASCEP